MTPPPSPANIEHAISNSVSDMLITVCDAQYTFTLAICILIICSRRFHDQMEPPVLLLRPALQQACSGKFPVDDFLT